MALNGISTLATKELRQIAKLDLASAKRVDENNPRAYYDINLLPTKYSGNEIVDNPHPDGLVEGRPWIAGEPEPAEPSYTLEFRSITGEGEESWEPGDVITTCNEGEIISFAVYGTDIPEDENAYIQFSGANISSTDGQFPFEGSFTDPIPSVFSGNVPPPPEGPWAPLLIEADNLTEGNETLTLSWVVNGETVATTSVQIVDTSISPPLEEPVQLVTNSDFSDGTDGWTAAGGFGTYSYSSSNQVALNNGELYFTYVLRTVSRNIDVSSIIANALSLKATVNIRHREKGDAATYTQIDTYTFTARFKNSSGATVTTKTTGLSNAPQTATDIDLTLNRSEIPTTFGTITSVDLAVSGIDTGYWNGNHGPIVKYITLTAS
jgi:hypothetical protein